MPSRRLLSIAALIVGSALPLLAAEPTPTDSKVTPSGTTQPATAATPGSDRTALEQDFAKKLTNVRMVGSYMLGKDGEPKQDSYTLVRAVKKDGDIWAITAKVEYRGFAVPVEIDVPVLWAGDTPVISVTDKKIPLLGTFTARVMFYGDQYVGTWSAGGDHGGLMWGNLEKPDAGAGDKKVEGSK